ncbi:MAG: hypothetical protein ACKVPX_02480 [Myxococcaceae bacterium]
MTTTTRLTGAAGVYAASRAAAATAQVDAALNGTVYFGFSNPELLQAPTEFHSGTLLAANCSGLRVTILAPVSVGTPVQTHIANDIRGWRPAEEVPAQCRRLTPLPNAHAMTLLAEVQRYMQREGNPTLAMLKAEGLPVPLTRVPLREQPAIVGYVTSRKCQERYRKDGLEATHRAATDFEVWKSQLLVWENAFNSLIERLSWQASRA